MYEILTKITEGHGTVEDLDLLEELGEVIKDSSMCGLGTTAPNPVLSTLRYFRDEYLAHIKDKSCPAGVCKALVSYEIDSDKCTGCLACKKNCPEQAIEGERKIPHKVDQNKCIKCGRELSCIFEAPSLLLGTCEIFDLSSNRMISSFGIHVHRKGYFDRLL